MSSDLPSWELMAFKWTTWTINFLIITSTIIFFIKFLTLRKKSVSMYMILILTLSDLSFPLMNMITNFVVGTGKIYEDTLYITAVGMYRFSLYWSTVIAIFSYLILAEMRFFDGKKFLLYSLLICSILTLFCPALIIFNVFGVGIKTIGPGMSTVGFFPSTPLKQYTGWFLFDIVGTFFPSIIIFYCYYKLYKILKVKYESIIEHAEMSAYRLFLYVAIPIICFTPWTIADIYNITTGKEYSFGVVLLASSFRRAWGFLNILAYWFLNPGYGGRKIRSYSEGTSESGLQSDNEEQTKRILTL